MFSQSIWKCTFLRVLVLALGLVATGSEVRGQVTVGLDSTTLRSFPQRFYGANGQERNSVPWCQQGNPDPAAFAIGLQGLQYALLRFPAGTGSDYWDWADGDYVDNYQLPSAIPPPPSPFRSPLSELKSELSSCNQPGQQMAAVFPLNVLEDPTCKPPMGSKFCAYSQESPNESYQLTLLSTLQSDNIRVPHVELGNELYGGGGTDPFPTVYPTGQAFATRMNTWIADIRVTDPSATISIPMAICDQLVSCDARKGSWNANVLGTIHGEDAVTLHNYSPSGLTTGPTIDNTSAETMLNQPFLFWDQIVSMVFPTLVDSTGSMPNVWFTEYNFRDDNIQAAGTWAHGLYLATYSLLYATNPRVKMALHHAVQGGAEFGDLFDSTNGFAGFPVAQSITTTLYGYSASGLTSREVDIAGLSQSQAEALTFNGGPTFSDGHPKLVGELYTGAANAQLIILNLDNQAHNINLSALSVLSNGGSYRQIYGDAGAYVDGDVIAGGFRAWTVSNSTNTEDDLTLATQTTLPTTLKLHPFSITRISAN